MLQDRKVINGCIKENVVICINIHRTNFKKRQGRL